MLAKRPAAGEHARAVAKLRCRGYRTKVTPRGFSVPRRFGLLAATWALALVVAGCGENKRDVFMRGLEIEGIAEKGPCALHYAENAQAATLSGNDVAECLRQTELAIAEYEKAATMGLAGDPEFVTVYDRSKVRRERLASMLKHVRAMETTQMVEGRR